MPELPEVETIRRSLSARLLARRIERFEAALPKAVKGIAPEEASARLAGQIIGGLSRRGKYLLLELANGDQLAFHLRMTGQLLLQEAGAERDPHTRLVFALDGREELRYVDQRKFGGFHYLAGGGDLPAGLADLGPEPLGAKFTQEYLANCLARRRIPIKGALLDQKMIAGIGNIYADEILHRAGIAPHRRADSLTPQELGALYASIRATLADGIAHRGTTRRNYVDGDGRPGGYQEKLAVYGRAGRPCPQCGAAVDRVRLCGRGTYYCPECQK